jgi:hypothetical protein
VRAGSFDPTIQQFREVPHTKQAMLPLQLRGRGLKVADRRDPGGAGGADRSG